MLQPLASDEHMAGETAAPEQGVVIIVRLQRHISSLLDLALTLTPLRSLVARIPSALARSCPEQRQSPQSHERASPWRAAI